jgi:glycerophosphoryl diester phosphodiesterase
MKRIKTEAEDAEDGWLEKIIEEIEQTRKKDGTEIGDDQYRTLDEVLRELEKRDVEIVVEVEEEGDEGKEEEITVEVKETLQKEEDESNRADLEYLKAMPLKDILEELSERKYYLIEKSKDEVEEVLKQYIDVRYGKLGFSRDNFNLKILKWNESDNIKESYIYIKLKNSIKNKKQELIKKLLEEEAQHYFIID